MLSETLKRWVVEIYDAYAELFKAAWRNRAVTFVSLLIGTVIAGIIWSIFYYDPPIVTGVALGVLATWLFRIPIIYYSVRKEKRNARIDRTGNDPSGNVATDKHSMVIDS